MTDPCATIRSSDEDSHQEAAPRSVSWLIDPPKYNVASASIGELTRDGRRVWACGSRTGGPWDSGPGEEDSEAWGDVDDGGRGGGGGGGAIADDIIPLAGEYELMEVERDTIGFRQLSPPPILESLEGRAEDGIEFETARFSASEFVRSRRSLERLHVSICDTYSLYSGIVSPQLRQQELLKTN